MKIKKPKTQKKKNLNVVKRILKFEDYKYCLEATQLENKINHLEKNNLNVDNIRENHKEFIKNNKLTSKSQQKFRIKKYNVFTEEVNKIALNSNDDNRIQSIDSIEPYAYGTNKDLVYKKEVINVAL